MDVVKDLAGSEIKSALGLAQELDGHALAISFMAGLIQERSWTIEEFFSIYETNKRDVHGQSQPNALSTIWDLSFRSLNQRSAALLGIFSYINPDSVAQKLFTEAKPSSLPPCLQGYTNEFAFSSVFEPLLTLALNKRDKIAKAFSTHRLVQTQYRYFLSQSDRQQAFDQAVKLLYDGFGRVDGQLYDRWSNCQMYIQQILSLKNNYKKEQSEPDGVHSTLLFCQLLDNSSR